MPLGIFLTTRLLDCVLLLILGRAQFDPSTLPVAPGRPPLESGRSYGDLIANWDGQWYRYIVEHGYPAHLPVVHGAVTDNQWAFYPLYPALVKLVTWTGMPFGPAASLVSTGFGAAAMCLLYRMLAPRLGGYAAGLSVLALCVAPAAVIWQSAYTESLALFLVLVALEGLRDRRYGIYLAAALALSLTRPIVLPLAAVVTVHGLLRWRRRRTEPFPAREVVRSCAAGILTVTFFAIWPIVAALITDRRDAYFVTQRAWLGAESEGGWPSWIRDFVLGANPALLVLVPAACLVLALLLLRRPAARWSTELRSWAALYPLYLLCATTATTSIFRYAMLSVIPWWPFPEIGAQVTARRERWAMVTLVCILGLAVQLLWMRWFWIIGPAALERP